MTLHDFEIFAGDGFDLQSKVAGDARHARLGSLVLFFKDSNCCLQTALIACSSENREKCKPPIPQRELDKYVVQLWFAVKAQR